MTKLTFIRYHIKRAFLIKIFFIIEDFQIKPTNTFEKMDILTMCLN